MKKTTSVIQVLLISFCFSCNSIINTLDNKSLLENKSLLDIEFLHLFDIDTTQTYDTLYLKGILEYNQQLQSELYNLYDTLLNFKNDLIEEKLNSKKVLKEKYNEKIDYVDRNKDAVRSQIDFSKNINDKIERYMRKH